MGNQWDKHHAQRYHLMDSPRLLVKVNVFALKARVGEHGGFDGVTLWHLG